MSSIIKVNTVQDQDGNNIINESGNTVTIGKSGDNVKTGGNNIQASDGGNLISQSGTTITLGASGDTVEIASGATLVGGGIDWQSAVKTANFTAVAGEGYFIDTTSATHTITLPGSPTLGDEISIIDYAGTFDTNALTVGRNGNPIQGSAADLTVSTERAGFTLVFVDGTQGWLLKDK